MADFHFLRPAWLVMILLVPLLYSLRHRLHQSDTGWGRYIPANLLQPLVRQGNEAASGAHRLPPLLLSLVLVIMAIALAGPSWRQAPTPLKHPQDSLVIALDLSLSMLATDVQPDRLTRAKRKIRDILDQRQGSLTALLVYSGDTHVVTPLTDDRRTIEAMLEVLEPTIMPAQGNRADLAINQAVELLQQGAPGRGRILVIADEVPEPYFPGIQKRLSDTPFSLSTLAAGSPEGGPIPLGDRGFIRDKGSIVITRANPESLARLAQDNNGLSHRLTLDETDIRALKLQPEQHERPVGDREDLTINRWQDDGYWLLWLCLPLALAAWRKGALAILMLSTIPLTLSPRPAAALDWSGLWQREDQRAPELIEQDPAAAAGQLKQPGWRGSALYRNRQYQEAADAFSQQPGATGHYNRGNALARAGQIDEALEAYQAALELSPDFEDARANEELMRQLIKQQKEQQKEQQGGNRQNQGQKPGDQPPSQTGENTDNGSDNPGDQSQSRQQPQNKPADNSKTEPQNAPDKESFRPGQRQEQESGTPQQDSPPPENQTPAATTGQPLSQGQEQWLRRIPDNPGGLLQRKFLQQHQQRQIITDEGDTPW